MLKEKKSYTVVDWYANKVAKDVKRNISCCDVFAVLKETEKAAYCMMCLGCDFKRCMWVPKSVLIEREIGEGHHGFYNHETYFIKDYEEACKEFKYFWSKYK